MDWRPLRDRLVASPRFRRWAAAFPLTRPVARRRARALFDLAAGFVYSQTLLACVRLDLFALLRPGPLTPADIAARTRLAPDAALRLLHAAASLGLLEARGGGRFGLGPLGGAMLGEPGLAAMVAHHARLYADLADPVALLRGEAKPCLASLWPYATAAAPADLSAASVAEYSDLMAATQPMIAAEILAAYDVSRHRRLLDIGGGDGAFLREAARAAPALALALADLPAVAERARARLDAAGVSADIFPGDIGDTPIPPAGFDLVTLIRVIHDHDDDRAITFLRAARRALAPGGTLLLAEPMAEAAGAEPVGAAYFGFYLLAMGSGRARTPGELRALLGHAGFTRSRVIPTRLPLVTSVLVAN